MHRAQISSPSPGWWRKDGQLFWHVLFFAVIAAGDFEHLRIDHVVVAEFGKSRDRNDADALGMHRRRTARPLVRQPPQYVVAALGGWLKPENRWSNLVVWKTKKSRRQKWRDLSRRQIQLRMRLSITASL